MASQFALAVARKFADRTIQAVGGVGILEVGAVTITLDAELQEVREVLDECARRIEQLNEGTEELGLDPTLRRVGKLMKRLEVK